MERKCQKCGNLLAQNDFLCPNCGAIYGEPTYEAPKAAEKPAPAAQKRGGRFVLFGGIALLIILASLLLWDPFRPAATMPSTSQTQPTTSALPTPPPTTLLPTVPTTVPPTTVPPTTLPFNQKQFEWTMHGTWIQNGQATQNTVAFTITGAIPIKADPGGPVQVLSLSTSWPEGFTYANQNETPFPVTPILPRIPKHPLFL